MSLDELRDPCPADVVLDTARVMVELGDRLAEDPALHYDLEHDELSWMLSGFDEYGIGRVDVIHKRSGQVIATARVHWRSLAVGPAL